MSNQLTFILNIKTLLQQEFDMSDEGELHFTLGNAIIRNKSEGWTFYSSAKISYFQTHGVQYVRLQVY